MFTLIFIESGIIAILSANYEVLLMESIDDLNWIGKKYDCNQADALCVLTRFGQNP